MNISKTIALRDNILNNCSVKTFEDVMQFLGLIPNINRGGCGMAALSCYRWLEKNHSEVLGEFSLVYCYYREEGRLLTKNMNILASQKFKDIWTPPHIAFRYRGILLESGGGEVGKSDFELFHDVTPEFLVDNLKYGVWNSAFQRFFWCPVIEKVLDISLQDVIEFQQRNELLKSV